MQARSLWNIGCFLLWITALLWLCVPQPSLSDLSAVHIGDLVILKVCGVEVEQGLLRERLTSAAIAITAITAQTARHLAAVLAAKDCRNAPSS